MERIMFYGLSNEQTTYYENIKIKQEKNVPSFICAYNYHILRVYFIILLQHKTIRDV